MSGSAAGGQGTGCCQSLTEQQSWRGTMEKDEQDCLPPVELLLTDSASPRTGQGAGTLGWARRGR